MLSYHISEHAKKQSGLLVVITHDSQLNQQLSEEVCFFNEIPILQFPDWETLPYDHFSPHQDIISERLKTLSLLPHLSQGILFISVHTLMQKLAPTYFIQSHAFNINVKEKINLNPLREKLVQAGYHLVTQVIAPGEFAIRGSLFDIFPMGSPLPYRIDLFDDEIESIRTFDPETQRTLEKIDHINLLPAREFPFDKNAIELFRQQWREQFNGNPTECVMYETISQGSLLPGVEYYLPLFFKETANLFDYLPKNTVFIKLEKSYDAAEKYWTEIKHRHEELRHDRLRPILPLDKLFLNPTDVFTQVKNFTTISLTAVPGPEVSLSTLPHVTGKILFCAESAGRREALLTLLQKNNINPTPVENWKTFLEKNIQHAITVAPIYTTLFIEPEQITLIPENALLGDYVLQKRRRKTKTTDLDAIFKNLSELTIGSPVVHIDHGVGRYLGLQTLTIGDQTNEFLTLEYANSAKLYVPVSALHLISRYSGIDPEHAPLHKLGTDQWEKAKKKAQEQIHDVAAELLEIHAKREMREGFVHTLDANYQLFKQQFPFEETADQEQAIEDVLNDMRSTKSMDRLICGDVGFGKTEVAMRAAFVAVQNNYQVAVLVPTTLLAQQHFQSFSDRFADWPIKIDMLSRFKTKDEQKNILENLSDGKIDIVIGTHKLLQPDIKFKKLGLLIIDEEHRFGVRQKEKLKSLRAEVDILTLTATPIPRTLNMAMSSMRDLSIIGTPPLRRLSIKTFVHPHNISLIREAILREILRGGQVFYLHNDVETIFTTAEKLREAIPEARIAVAHGQMRERELERIMREFYHQQHNVLICTTIIETGIDIPSANTIIIERADKFGLAQLHQLRGRVGRSHHQAYAYLLTPPHQKITPDAEKRLEAITQLEDLGAGFALATHDLEIRGAGELLGEHQSGNMQEIGFSLYMELLDRAVRSLKKGKLEEPIRAEIDLQIPALIPEDYLPDVHTRLVLYKRLANAKNKEELDDLHIEFIDRFGLLPSQTKNLFLVTELKLKAQDIGILKIHATEKSTRIEFTENPNIDSSKLIQLIQKESPFYKLDGHNKIRILKDQPDAQIRIKYIEEFLEKILP